MRRKTFGGKGRRNVKELKKGGPEKTQLRGRSVPDPLWPMRYDLCEKKGRQKPGGATTRDYMDYHRLARGAAMETERKNMGGVRAHRHLKPSLKRDHRVTAVIWEGGGGAGGRSADEGTRVVR